MKTSSKIVAVSIFTLGLSLCLPAYAVVYENLRVKTGESKIINPGDTVNNYGNTTLGGSVVNNGLIIKSGSSIFTTGTFNNNGNIVIHEAGSISGTFKNNVTGYIMMGGYLDMYQVGSLFENSGRIDVVQPLGTETLTEAPFTFVIRGTIKNNSTGVIRLNRAIPEPHQHVCQAGTSSVGVPVTFYNQGLFEIGFDTICDFGVESEASISTNEAFLTSPTLIPFR